MNQRYIEAISGKNAMLAVFDAKKQLQEKLPNADRRRIKREMKKAMRRKRQEG